MSARLTTNLHDSVRQRSFACMDEKQSRLDLMQCAERDLTYGMTGPIIGRVHNITMDRRGSVHVCIVLHSESIAKLCLERKMFVDVSWTLDMALFTGHWSVFLSHIFIEERSRFVGALPLRKLG